MLQLCLFAITDNGNNPALQGTQALVIGILIVIIGVSLGMNSGYAINPSRDLPPRFFTCLAGWGTQVFRYCLPSPFCQIFYDFHACGEGRGGGDVRSITGESGGAARWPGEAGVGPDLPYDQHGSCSWTEGEPCPRSSLVPESGCS